MSEATASKTESLGANALKIVGCVAAVAVGRYSGLNLLIPLVFTAVVWWLATKFLPEDDRVIVPAFAVQCGHALWMALGLAVLGTINESVFDIVLLAGGLVWLLASPGVGPLYVLGGYQLIALPITGYLFYNVELGSTDHKALLVHVVWRALALFLIVQLFAKVRKASPLAPGARQPRFQTDEEKKWQVRKRLTASHFAFGTR